MKKYFVCKAKNYECRVEALDIPNEMIKNGEWVVLDSTATETDIDSLENEWIYLYRYKKRK